jgi:hypothetical protein
MKVSGKQSTLLFLLKTGIFHKVLEISEDII